MFMYYEFIFNIMVFDSIIDNINSTRKAKTMLLYIISYLFNDIITWYCPKNYNIMYDIVLNMISKMTSYHDIIISCIIIDIKLSCMISYMIQPPWLIYDTAPFKLAICIISYMIQPPWQGESSFQSFDFDGMGSIPAISPTQITCSVDHFNKLEW
jgi:hypothetical protein